MDTDQTTEDTPEFYFCKVNDSEDLSSYNDGVKTAVWSRSTTLSMLSLYEAKIDILKDTGKKSHIWKHISDDLKDFNIMMTENQVKWKFNRLLAKYKECTENKKHGRGPVKFEYYEQFKDIFHKDKNPLQIEKPSFKKNEFVETASRSLKRTSSNSSDNETVEPVVRPKKKLEITMQNQCFEMLQNIKEQQKCRDEKLAKYLKIKEKEVEMKRQALEMRENEIKRKRALDKFKEKKHEDWLKIEKQKCKLLRKFLKISSDSEDSDI